MAIRRTSAAAASNRGRRAPGGKRRKARRSLATRAQPDMRRFRLAMENSADMISLIDRETMRYIDVNSTVCKLLGYSKRELLRMGPPDVVLESREALARAYDALIADPSSSSRLKSRYRRKDGSQFPFESRRQVFRSGKRWIIAVISRDITDQVQAEQALRESEARFRSLLELSSDMYWEQDEQYRFTMISGTNRDWLRELRQRLIGKRRWDQSYFNMTEDDWTAHRALLDARGSFRELELGRINEKDEKVWVSVSGEPVFDGGGKFAGYRGAGRDITAQKRSERLLRLEHQVARALSEAEDAACGVSAVMRSICESQDWVCGRHFDLDEPAGLLRFKDAWCIADRGIEQFVQGSRKLTFRPGQGLAGTLLQAGGPVWSTDASNDPRVWTQQLWAAAGIRGAFAFALVSEGRHKGVLVFSSRSLREPDERLLEAARVIGSQVGQFLQRKRTEDALRESEARFRSLTQMSSDFFWEMDAQSRFTQLVHGPHYVPQFGSVIIGKAAWELPSTMPDEAGWARLRATVEAREPIRDFEFGRARADGAVRYFSVSGEPRIAGDGSFLGYRGVGRDITEDVLSRERIASLAYSDPLTGLANRTSLGPALEQAVERARRRGTRLATLFIDLDGFKQMNDAYGHPSGDRFLIETARRLRAGLRASDLVARLGGDEFFVVLEDVPDTGLIETVARKLLAEIMRPFELAPGDELRVSASVGIAVFPEHAADAATLIKNADIAMYKAKQAGKNAFRFFAPSASSYDRSESSVA